MGEPAGVSDWLMGLAFRIMGAWGDQRWTKSQGAVRGKKKGP